MYLHLNKEVGHFKIKANLNNTTILIKKIKVI